MDLSAIGSGALSILAGGVTGLLGGVVQKVYEYKTRSLEAEMQRDREAHEIALRRVDAEIMQQEYAARIRVAETEAAGKEAVADGEAFQASLTSEPVRYSDSSRLTPAQMWLMVALDAIRGIVRPALTLYLCGISTLVYLQARSLIGPGAAALSSEQAVELVRLTVDTLLYLTSTCVLWWFGSRSKERAQR